MDWVESDSLSVLRRMALRLKLIQGINPRLLTLHQMSKLNQLHALLQLADHQASSMVNVMVIRVAMISMN
jgi:hypothetical protein